MRTTLPVLLVLVAALAILPEPIVADSDTEVVLLEDLVSSWDGPANRTAAAKAAEPPSRCGDRLRTGDEQCDDGNTHNGDGCDDRCKVEKGYRCTSSEAGDDVCQPVCGDGRMVGTELCDDGNLIDNDGCSHTCALEAGFDCQEGNVDQASLCKPVCGDGMMRGAEQCDDGNLIPEDGCSGSCFVEPGYNCTALAGDHHRPVDAPAAPRMLLSTAGFQGISLCHPVCGDGRRVGVEECDDDNTLDGDGCSASCKVEPRMFCHGGSVSSKDLCFPLVCGDAKTGGDEACDDGAQRNGDGCDDACQVEEGWSCDASPSKRSQCTPICGDGVQLGSEECDDGNSAAGDGCDGCKLEPGWQCPPGQSCSQIVCGDGMVAASEACDDGNAVNGDGCSNAQAKPACGVELGWSCANGTAISPSRCISSCGDGRRVGYEACDDGNSKSNDGCSDLCTVEPGFVCNEGDASGSSLNYYKGGGDSTLTLLDLLAPNNTAPQPVPKDSRGKVSSCAAQVCGDGKRFGTESCDDFNAVDGDGCDSSCAVEEGWQCEGGSWTQQDTCAPRCGDGIVMEGEACDDGNLAVGDGCSDKCMVEPGWSCQQGECSTVCGDEQRAGDEQCDDGNKQAGDGCSDACQVEEGWSCAAPAQDSADVCVRKIDCQTSPWGDFAACDQPCGGGVQKRARTVLIAAENGGTGCPKLVEDRACNTQGCVPVDCVVSAWAGFSACTKPCGGGTHVRLRSISTPTKHGGGPCPALTEERPCNTAECAVLGCQVTQWSSWTECDAACGGGNAQRTRAIKQHPANGGAACPVLSQSRACNTQGCPQPVDCAVSEWTSWNECDKECGSGLMTRNRQIQVEAAHGGASCPVAVESRKCNTQGCPPAELAPAVAN